jgi:hypothetical protein
VDQILRSPSRQPSDSAIFSRWIDFATFVFAFASINAKVARLTVIVAKKGSIMTHKKNRDLAGAKKKYSIVARQCSLETSPETLQQKILLLLQNIITDSSKYSTGM